MLAAFGILRRLRNLAPHRRFARPSPIRPPAPRGIRTSLGAFGRRHQQHQLGRLCRQYGPWRRDRRQRFLDRADRHRYGRVTTYSSAWVGIDGFSSTTVEQTGTEMDVTSSGKVEYSAWYELYPNAEITIPSITVRPVIRSAPRLPTPPATLP